MLNRSFLSFFFYSFQRESGGEGRWLDGLLEPCLASLSLLISGDRDCFSHDDVCMIDGFTRLCIRSVHSSKRDLGFGCGHFDVSENKSSMQLCI